MKSFTDTQFLALNDMFDLLDQMRELHEKANFDKTFAEFLQACATAEQSEEVSVN